MPFLSSGDKKKSYDHSRTPSPGPSSFLDGYANPGFSHWSGISKKKSTLTVPNHDVTVTVSTCP